MGEYIRRRHVLYNKGGVFQDNDAHQMAVVIVKDEYLRAFLDNFWPLNVPTEIHVNAVSSCGVETTVAVSDANGVFLDEVAYWAPHVSPITG